MTERKGITVMMLGFVIGIILIVVFIIFVVLFYEGDLFGGIMKGLGNAINSFMGGGGEFGGGGYTGSSD